jgi:hypothetical protein
MPQTIEPFASFRFQPRLYSWRYPKNMSLTWDYGNAEYHEFKQALDSTAMNGELQAIWQGCKPNCDRRACFSWSTCTGHMGCVPHAAGEAAFAVVRKYYGQALATMEQKLLP